MRFERSATHRISFWTILCCLAIIALPITGHCDYRHGFELYKQRDHLGAMSEFRSAVETRQFDGYKEVVKEWLAVGFSFGIPPEVNGLLLSWLGTAAEMGPADTQWGMSRLWLLSRDETRGNDERLRWLTLAASNGHAEAAWDLWSTLPGSRSEERIYWLRRAAELGHLDAQRNLLTYYFQGSPNAGPDHTQAFRWAKQLADRGDALGMAYLGMLYYGGRGVERNYEEAARWLKKAYDAGQRSNIIAGQLATIYERGLGVAADSEEAKRWRQREAEMLRRSRVND